MKSTPHLLSPTIAPEPGLYSDIPDFDYHEWDLCSNSRLSILKQFSAAHLKSHMQKVRKPFDNSKPVLGDDYREIGTASHFAILQPELFQLKYFRCPDDLNRTTTEGKATWKNLRELHPDRIGLKAQIYDDCVAMHWAALGHPECRAYLEAAGQVEASIVWDEPEFGLRCKARIDRICEDFGGVLIDIKSAESIEPETFKKAVWNRGYYRQIVMYRDAVEACGIDVRTHKIMAFEKGARFLKPLLFEIDEVLLQMAREELTELKRAYAKCLDRDIWPGYGDETIMVSAPGYALNRMEA